MMQSEQIDALAKALSTAQGLLEDPHKGKTAKVKGQTKSGSSFEYEYKYADIADVLKGIRKVLAESEIAVSQATIVDGNTLILRTQLSHSSGQWIAGDYPVCSINGDHQKMGAAMTYARRYALTAMIGVAADEDTDGQGAETPAGRNGNGRAETGELISEDQVKEIWARLEETQADIAKFCAYFKIDSVPALKASQYDAALSAIDASAKKRKAA